MVYIAKLFVLIFKQSLHINNKVSENENLNIYIYINKVSYKCLDMHGMPV